MSASKPMKLAPEPVEMRPIPSEPGYFVTKDGVVYTSWQRPGFLIARKPHIRVRNYHYVNFRKRPGETRQHYQPVHHLVLEAWGYPKPPFAKGEKRVECRHLDGDGSNNRLENLVWGTNRENHNDRIRMGRACRGETHYEAKLTEEMVRAARAERRAGASYRALANKYGVTLTPLRNAVTGVTWTEIPGPVTDVRPFKKLTDENIREILFRRSDRAEVLAKEFGVHWAYVNFLWRHNGRRPSRRKHV